MPEELNNSEVLVFEEDEDWIKNEEPKWSQDDQR